MSDDVTIMTSSSRKVVYMFRIKFPTERIFRIFPILRTVGMAPFGTYLWNDPRISRCVILMSYNVSRLAVFDPSALKRTVTHILLCRLEVGW